jgi:hypothetical protein
MRKRSKALLILAVLAAPSVTSAQPMQPSSLRPEASGAWMSRTPSLPLLFETNRGQSDPEVAFLARGAGSMFFFTSREAVVRMIAVAPGPNATTPIRETVVRIQWGSESRKARLIGEDPRQARSHYFVGSDREQWLSDVETYGRVVARDAYPGIDIVFRDHSSFLELDFVVSPGVDPGIIDLGFPGVDSIRLDDGGAAVLEVAGSELRLAPPDLYQEVDGVRESVPGAYVLREGHRIGFRVGDYDESRTLIIDPILHYSSFLGGIGPDFGHAIAVDDSGHAYVAGQTLSSDFPRTLALANPGPRFVAYVAKLDPAGSSLVYSTFLGATDTFSIDNIRFDMMGIAVDNAGFVYVAGDTSDPDFPTVNALQPQIGGHHDAFVTKLSPSGSTLVFSTYLGGVSDDWARGLALGPEGSVYVVGIAQSPNFPTFNALQPVKSGARDAFVVKLEPSGSSFAYSTYLGGNDLGSTAGFGDFGYDIAVDSAGNAYVTGLTTSANFPTAMPFQPALGGGAHDGFVAKLSADGSALLYSSFLGGGDKDEGLGIAVDAAGAAYVTGWTASTDFPILSATQASLSGTTDAFVTKLAPDGQSLSYSTYLGGGLAEIGWDIAVNHAGQAHLIGTTGSANFPVANPLQPAYGGGPTDAFVTRLGADGSIVSFSTFLGGAGEENTFITAAGIDLSRSSVYVTGNTVSADFPLADPLQGTPGGMIDAFVAKIGTAPEILLRVEAMGSDNVLSVKLSNGSLEPRLVHLKLWVILEGGIASILPAPVVLKLAPGEVRQFTETTLPANVRFPGSRIGGRLLDPVTGEVLSEKVCASVPCR